ncbi:60S ribosomal subunit assembly or modification protein, partial [Exophiala xenobiotica]
MDEDDLLAAEDAAEEIPEDEDQPMDEDPDEDDQEIQEELLFQNDSSAHFDAHNDSIFCIAQHPSRPSIIVTGGGDDVAYIFDASTSSTPST